MDWERVFGDADLSGAVVSIGLTTGLVVKGYLTDFGPDLFGIRPDPDDGGDIFYRKSAVVCLRYED